MGFVAKGEGVVRVRAGEGCAGLFDMRLLRAALVVGTRGVFVDITQKKTTRCLRRGGGGNKMSRNAIDGG